MIERISRYQYGNSDHRSQQRVTLMVSNDPLPDQEISDQKLGVVPESIECGSQVDVSGNHPSSERQPDQKGSKTAFNP
ncbi:hypothetical protein DTL21_15070 [Bremerella cremea]|nr:hypothetical protein DTL21_15070 [Bremerella cremea]